MNKLRVLELFAGIGACSKALEILGIEHEIVDAVEIDKYAVKSFNAIHNTNFEPQDVTQWDKDIEVDLVMHGSPCQDFSLAGLQAGGDEGSGTRSSLMYETIRIVKKLKPKYVIWENVKNLLSKKHRHNFDAYLEAMEKLGYVNYYQVLNAKDYGIPQNRERVFTISILNDDIISAAMRGRYNNGKIEQHIEISDRTYANAITTVQKDSLICEKNKIFTFPPKQELKLKLKDMLEDSVDEKYYLSEEMTNKIKYKFKNENDLLGGMQEHQSIKKDGICTTLTSSMGTGGGYIPMVSRKYGIFDTDKSTHQAGSVYDENGLAPTLDTMQGGWRQPCVEVVGFIEKGTGQHQSNTIYDSNNLCPTICASESWKSPYKFLVKNATKKGYQEAYEGDSVNLSYPTSKTRRGRVGEQVSQTLQCNDAMGTITNDLRIRKLTPKECWRLMGFDDEDFDKASQVNSNTQLYKQAGNSIVVNVLMAIFNELLKKEGE